MVERLRKQERQWPQLRWFTLGAGLFGALCSSFIWIILLKHIDSALGDHGDFLARAWLFAFASFYPKCLLGFCLSAYLIGWTIRDWSGNTNRVLLLKLLEADQKDRAK
jgi:hypothetical protein